jgi:hypothetical protein
MEAITTLRELTECSESKLAVSLDLPTEAIAKVRAQSLQEGADYVKAGKGYRYTGEGIKRLLEALGLLVNIDTGDVFRAVVKAIPRNPNMLLCELSDHTQIRVRVKTQLNFMPEMEIQVKPDIGTPLFNYVGQYPRIRGRL